MQNWKLINWLIKLLTLLSLSTGLKSQSDPLWSVNYSSGGYFPVSIEEGDSGSVWVMGGEKFTQQKFLKISNVTPYLVGSTVNYSVRFSSNNSDNYFRLGNDCTLLAKDSLLFALVPIHHWQDGDKNILLQLNLVLGEALEVPVPDNSDFVILPNNTLVVAGSSIDALILQERNLGLEQSGVQFFNYVSPENVNLYFSDVIISETPNNGYIVCGNGFLLNESHGYLSRYDSSGSPEWGLGFPNVNLVDVCQIGELILGCIEIEKQNITGQIVSEPVLFLLDKEIELIWTKHLAYPIGDLPVIGYIEGVGIMFSTYLSEHDATIFLLLDLSGEILGQFAFPGRLKTFSFKDDLFGISINYGQNGYNWSLHSISPNGLIGECEVIPSCVSLSDTIVESYVFNIQEFNATLFDTSKVAFLVDSGTINLQEGCFNDLMAPDPDFSLDSKVCIGDTVKVVSNLNNFSDSTSWHLTGPSVDSTLADSLAFRYVFTQPGIYTLEQTIWYLGCAYNESHEVEVLPPLELSILPEGPACSSPLQLGLQASRPLQQVQWAHGPTETNITVQNQGWYTVTASDGICTATDNLQVVFVDSLLAGEAPLVLPPDTMVCVQDLPFSLDVLAPLADSLLLDGIRTAPTLPLPEAGTYLISACIQGCCYSESFNLEVYDCAPRIYMPTAISPNGDGINDELYPQGKNFTTLSLKVFHRWGGLLHSTEGPDARWDAHDAPPGTYVWLLEYRSHYDGSTQRMSGEVEVVR